jgi:GT2 family glycosyltransferase
MRISFVSPCGDSGGVLYPLDLANELAMRGHDITFWMVSFQGENPSVTGRFVKYVRLDDLVEMFREIDVSDVVVATNWQAVSLVSRIGLSPPKKLINLIQGDERGWAPREEVTRLMSLPDWKNIFASMDLRDRMCADGIPDGPVIHDGISDVFFDGLEMERKYDVGFIWSPLKNCKVIPHAIGRIMNMVGIGVGERPPELFGIPGDWIEGPISREDLANIMRQTSFWLCPSKEEGFGLVPIEAMACGAYPITAKTGVMKDIFKDHWFALEGDPDDEEMWMEAIGELVRYEDHADAEIKKAKRAKRIQLARTFSIENAAIAMEREIGHDPTLSVCMITKNGKELLDGCLTSIDGMWDELIIVIDDDPEEGIEDVCLKHGATIFHRSMNHDFASQRNFGFEKATGDWIAWFDSDDYVPPATVAEMRRLVNRSEPGIAGYYFDYHYTHDGNMNVTTCLRRERLLRRSSGWSWKYEIHEICECSDPQTKLKFANGFPVIHKREQVPQEFVDPGRNLRFLEKVMEKYEGDTRMMFYAAKEHLAAGDRIEAMRYFKMVVGELSKQSHYDEHLFVSCMEIAIMYNATEDLKHARTWAYKALDADPRWAETYCLLGHFAEKMGDVHQAIDMFEAARNLPIPDDVVLPTNPSMYGEFPTEMISRLMAMDVIIPVHGGADYLELCLSSLGRNSLSTTAAIVVANPPEIERIREIIEDSPGTILIENDRDLSFASNCNIGISFSRKAKICLLNSDTIVTPGWDRDLIDVSNGKGNSMSVIAAFSNGEYGWRHEEAIVVDDVPLVNKHRIEDLGCDPRRIEEVCGKWAFDHKGEVEEHDWVTFASCLIPRRVIRDVGLLDEKYRNSMEDIDYCTRLRRMGGRCLYSRGSFVFHFCGTSRYPDGKDSLVRDDVNTKVFQKKVSLSDMRISFFVGDSWEPWTPDSINSTGIGGSETCVVNVAGCLSDWGWNVEVFSTYLDHPIKRDGVVYHNHGEFDPSRRSDILVVSRKPHVFDHPLNARLKVLYNHDASYGDISSPIYPNEQRVSQMDILFMLSEWHHRAYAHMYPHIPTEKFVVTRNGIDIRRFVFGLQGVTQKDMKRCFYTSSADRGLESLLQIWPRLREIEPDLELHIFYGMETWKRSVELTGDEAAIERMNLILDGCKQPGINYRGRTGQMNLAREMMSSNLWLYPTAFHETSCLSGMESLASLCIPITTPIGALPETLSIPGPDGQRMAMADFVTGDCTTQEYQDAFVEAFRNRLEDPDMERRMIAREHILAHNDWRRIASEWTDLFLERM